MNRRNLVLGVALLVTLGLSAWTLVAPQPDDVVQARAQPAAEARSPAKAPPGRLGPASHAGESESRYAAVLPSAALALELPQRPQAPAQPHNLFGAYSYQPPPPKVVAAPPPPPQAPPLPYRFAGRLLVDGTATYFLMKGDEPVGVTLGAKIGDFQLVQADPRQLIFEHGPTGQRVTISIASLATK